MKPSILICVDWFAPGYKGGGPIRSCVNFAYAMRDSYTIYVLTSDRDWGNDAAYDGITPDTWMTFDEGIQVCYASPANLGYRAILEKIQAVSPDFIYLNSVYSLPFSIFPMLMKRFGTLKATMVLAPRGMLHSGALQYKSLKKKLFLALLRFLHIPQQLRYHATDAQESLDIQQQLYRSADMITIANFPNIKQLAWQSTPKAASEIHIVFISRIAEKKNLHFFLSLLKNIEHTIRLSVFGSFEDEHYRQTCLALVAALPPHISVVFNGDIEHHQLPNALRDAHTFVLPTFGENFGHAIFEALQAGKPVLISDQTPWRNLEAQRSGWDISLDNVSQWLQAVRTVAAWEQADFDTWSQAAWQYAKHYSENDSAKNDYLRLFY